MDYLPLPVPPGFVEIEFLDPDVPPVRWNFSQVHGWTNTDVMGNPLREVKILLTPDSSISYPREHILAIHHQRNGEDYVKAVKAYRMMLHREGHPERRDPLHPGNRLGNCRYCGADPDELRIGGGYPGSMTFNEEERALIRSTPPQESWRRPEWAELPQPEVPRPRRRNTWGSLIDTILGRD